MHDVIEVCRRFLVGEPQIGRADLDQVTAHPEPGKGQTGIGTCTDDKMDVGRQVLDEEAELLMNVGPVDEVEVVEDEDEGRLARSEMVDEERNKALIELQRRGQIREGRVGLGGGRPQGGNDAAPEG